VATWSENTHVVFSEDLAERPDWLRQIGVNI
jgi:hypothetical protein